MKPILNQGLLPFVEVDLDRSCKASATWSPPPLADLGFTRNCTAVASFINAILSSPYNTPNIVEYVRNALPLPETSRPTSGQLMDWLICSHGKAVAWHNGNGEISESLVAKPYEVCEVEVCNLIQWSGNADIAGLGMRMAYSQEAALVTLCYTVYCLGIYRFAPKIGKTVYPAVITGFIESTGPFFDTAVIFDISVTIASWNYLRMTDYAQIQSTLASRFATFPVLLTSMMSFGRRESWARHEYRIFLALVFVLVKISFYSLRWVLVAPGRWKQRPIPCKPTLPSKHILGLLVVYTVCWVFFVIAHMFGLRRRWAPMNPWWMVPLVVLMWAYLRIFARNRTASVKISSADVKWGFGQFLAIYTWALVLLMPVHFSIEHILGPGLTLEEVEQKQNRKKDERNDEHVLVGGALQGGPRCAEETEDALLQTEEQV